MSSGLLEAFGIERGVVALAGAGGKTTLLYRLAREAHTRGQRVLVTTTTHMGLPADEGAVVYGDADARAAIEAHGLVTLLGPRLRADKVQGIASERVDAWRSAADLVLVEADGARRRSFKIPAEHEPLVPSSTCLLIVLAGLDVLGCALDPEHVHRCDLVAAAAEQAAGTPVGEDTIARALVAPHGYVARTPAGARVGVFLNKAEGEARVAAARRLAARLAPPYSVVRAGSARDGIVVI